jgi:Initiator Rep protein, WH2/Initiator Replication protein, WH1
MPNPVKKNPSKKLRTVDLQPDEFSLIKPGELIDVVEMAPLTLQDRRIYNLLILNAWEKITEPIEHCIRKQDLRGSHHTSERVGDSIERLMAVIARVRIVKDGKPAIRRVQLLAPNDEEIDENGLLHYSFHAGLRLVLKGSSQFARLQKDVMFALGSKYALALYEVVQKRGNLSRKFCEEFTVEQFRQLLNVETGLYPKFTNLNQRVIVPAVIEVNGLGQFGCKVEPVYKGRKVIALRLTWWAKSLEQKKAALKELRVSRVGRRARLLGTVETIAPGTVPPRVELPKDGWSGLTDYQLNRLRTNFPGIDIVEMEKQFVEWVSEKGTPDNYLSALFGFIRQKVKREKPLGAVG